MTETSDNSSPAAPQASVKVWDPVVRIGHWVIVIGVFTAYFSGDDWQGIHVWAGYAVAAAVLIRIAWGLFGTRHARFASFVRGPGAAASYLRGLVSGKAERHAGHNPAGAVMILLLLASLAGTTGTGMALYAVEEGRGPLAGFIAMAPEDGAQANASSEAPRAADRDDDDDEHGVRGESGEHEEGGEGGEWLEGLHKFFVYLTLTLAGLHVIGVIASSLAHGENLVRSMVTGRKRAE
ncbi:MULTISPECIES: cytochrome b/b6 domain-containing protein [Hyphobacterium]|uniref:Cytochrome b/b6 domain-containing protein n=1 Tax=Hyphobacterium vulgare TaxID=1736751 RepID=A0ABV6ZUI3_9PROT